VSNQMPVDRCALASHAKSPRMSTWSLPGRPKSIPEPGQDSADVGYATNDQLKSDVTRRARAKVFCKLDAVDDAAIHSGPDGELVVPMVVVEVPRGHVLPPRFDSDAL